MQTLARDGLSDAEVTTLLLADELAVTGGLDLLNADLSLREDISDDLEGGQVTRGLYNTIHTACSLSITRELLWGVDLVRPYMVLTDGVRTARFNVGVFALTTPERNVGATPETYDVSGFDRLYLLLREVGDSYTVAAGTEVLTAVRAVVTAAGLSGVLLDGSATGVTVPVARVWPLVADSNPTTYLRIINDLLASINYRSLFTDENGLYRSEPYVEPAARGPQFTFDADSATTIVGEDRRVVEDKWKRPNKWVFVNTTLAGDPPPAPVEGAGIYTVNDTADQTARGLTWTSVVQYEAASQTALVGLGNRRVADDKRVTSTLTLTVGPFPPLGHADIYTYRDVALGVDRKVQLIAATVDLTGADTQMTLERVDL